MFFGPYIRIQNVRELKIVNPEQVEEIDGDGNVVVGAGQQADGDGDSVEQGRGSILDLNDVIW